MKYLWLLVCAVALSMAGCETRRSAEEQAQEAQELGAQGKTDLAVALLEKAIQQAPSDPSLRLMMAGFYLDLGRGDLAEVTIEQALERGAEPAQTAIPLARALFLQGRYFDVQNLEPPVSLSAALRLELDFIRAQAMLANSNPARRDISITRAFLQLLENIKQHAGTSAGSKIHNEIEGLASEWPDVDRALQHSRCADAAAAIIEWSPLQRSGAKVIRVGAGRALKTPAAAARLAGDGDVVEIDPGEYAGGVAHWPQNRLLVRGAGKRPQITAAGKSIKDRDVWLFTGDNVTVENVEISGARSRYENGAGIRHTGSGLTLRNVFLHDNENGVLTGNQHPDSRITIEFSELAHNGDGKGFAHNAYIGRSASLTFRFNYSHSVKGGHLLKSRAGENLIEYNRLTDEAAGTSAYIVDIAEGGTATILGNLIQQNFRTSNHAMISFAGERINPEINRLAVINNTAYNREFDGIFVRNHGPDKALVVNNLFAGAELVSTIGPGVSVNNLAHPEHGLVDWENSDFRLRPGAVAIDAGAEDYKMPVAQYRHPSQGEERKDIWRRDVGAYERCGI